VTRLRRADQVARNRNLVLAAARWVFLERGYAGASVDAIAEKAGFSVGVVYSQFGSKADLFFALLERRIEDRAAQNDRIADEFAGADAVRALLRAGQQDATAEPGWSFLLAEFRAIAMRDADLSERYARAHSRTLDGIASAFEKLYEPISLKPPVPVRTIAEFMQAGAVGSALERAVNPDALPDEDAERLLLRALGLDET
jgi:AcrR family transcriptional regulator